MDKQFLDKAGLQSVADNVDKRLKTLESMPVNPKSGQVVLYTGETVGDFVQGHTYEYSGLYAFNVGENSFLYFNTSELVEGLQVKKSVGNLDFEGWYIDELGTAPAIVVRNTLDPSSPDVQYATFSSCVRYPSKDILWTDITSGGTVDQSFNPDSSNAQSGIAVNEAKAVLFNKLFKVDTWNNKSWSGEGDYRGFAGSYVWKDGDNIYMSASDQPNYNYVLNKATSTWETKTWYGLTQFNGYYIWSDGTSIYYSNYNNQYVLNKSTDTWEPKTWQGLTSFNAPMIWSDGSNIYFSDGSNNYVLNKATSTWEEKTWHGYSSFYGDQIWLDGDNIYYSYDSRQYVLNKVTSTWEEKTWNDLTSFDGEHVWTDGNNIYYSYTHTNYVLNKATSTWEFKEWNNWDDIAGEQVWTYGSNVYYSNGSDQYVLAKSLKTYID